MEVRSVDPNIDGPLLINASPFEDLRGSFVERFNKEKFKKFGIPTEFPQENHCHSFERVLRGLHFQFENPQGKIVWVASGKIFDIALDIRPNSPTFLKHASVVLDSKNMGQMVWIPEGFAHGFYVLEGGTAEVIYKMTNYYNPKGEGGILWNDPDLKIPWPDKDPILSDRDKKLWSVEEFKERFAK